MGIYKIFTIIILLSSIFLVTPIFSEEVAVSTIKFIAVGDVLFENAGADPLRYVSEKIKSADISMCNLESPFTKIGKKAKKKYVFAGKPSDAKILADAGFDIVNLANNHILDYGDKSFSETLKLLVKNGVQYVGAGRDISLARTPVIFEKNGIKIAFLGYSNTLSKSFYANKNKSGTSPAYESFIAKDIKQAKKNSDIIVVSFHWGKESARRDFAFGELESIPHKRQVYLAHMAVDLGADILIGHHPHVLQTIEIYKGKVICYSLGNFLLHRKV